MQAPALKPVLTAVNTPLSDAFLVGLSSPYDEKEAIVVQELDLALRYVENIAGSAISFAEQQLNDYQLHDDYKELLTLTIIFLGAVPNKRISFRAPAGLHRARWMAKAIYCVKLFMVREQFKLKK
ncbi:unnamed protein product [Euphydryas editha]|uniref:Uncharacterized protein n=1 Tax=Euphydryas editha TaxID=104508 RepID=A0AAU9TRA6_EUPED|nr:unnamed protein product [Euphydryas editha]CAH2089534.1 unnamed protein product [Euphydryas editha]